MENEITTPLKVVQSLDFQELDDMAVRCDASLSENSSQLDEDKCYLLEIEQLKRQNNFLKKKLAELNKKHRVSLPVGVRKRPSGVLPPSSQQNLDVPQKNYIISFVQEVLKLLENFSSIFNISFENNLSKELQKQNSAFNELTTEKNSQLNQRLARVLLKPENKKYQQVLELFEGYYRENSQKNKNIKQKVESLTTEAIELGKKMVENIIERENCKKSVRGSRIFSVIREEESRPVREECLKSSIIKSTCTDEQFDLGNCRLGQYKEKMDFNFF